MKIAVIGLGYVGSALAEFLYKKFDSDYVDRILYKNAIDYLKVDSYE